jgi:hypothetical protein
MTRPKSVLVVPGATANAKLPRAVKVPPMLEATEMSTELAPRSTSVATANDSL